MYNYAIRNEKTSGRSAIKTIQQQNDIGIVRAPKGEQNSSVEEGRPTTVQSLNFKKLKSYLNLKPFFWIVQNELCSKLREDQTQRYRYLATKALLSLLHNNCHGPERCMH